MVDVEVQALDEVKVVVDVDVVVEVQALDVVKVVVAVVEEADEVDEAMKDGRRSTPHVVIPWP
jgi:hypothetical protein